MEKNLLSPTAPRLGFGLMRLPKVNGIIDIEETSAMVDAFLQAGFDYFDTAYVYDGSEEATRKALTARYPRSAYHIASKLPGTREGILLKEEDNERTFNESLERLGIDYFDCYLLHNASKERIALYERLHSWEFCERMKQQGRIRQLGFSFHDTPEKLRELLQAHPDMDFVQLQINFIDWNDPFLQARELYETARAFGKKVIVMEPIKGGMLASLRGEHAEALSKLNAGGTLASLALRFCASLAGVPIILSGMSTLEQMQENIETMRHVQPLSEQEREALLACTIELRKQTGIGCTACHYCVQGCPEQIPIPEYINTLNNLNAFGKTPGVVSHYDFVTTTASPAGACIACGQCESVCPQRLPIIQAMKDLAQALGK